MNTGTNTNLNIADAAARETRVMVLSEQPESTLTRIRFLIPLGRWAQTCGATLRLKAFDDFQLSDIELADIFIVQRGCNSYTGLIAACIKGRGKPVVYDIDDLLIELPPFLSHHVGMIKNRRAIVDLIQLADVVTCTQSVLAGQLKHLNSNVRICPNYGDPNYIAENGVGRPVKAESCTLVIAATDRVLVLFVLDAIKAILEKYGSSVRLVVIGPIGDAFRSAGVSADYYPIIPHEQFTQFVGDLYNPIGIIPLDDSLFSSCKSAIKYFDYSVAGLASICSDVTPYREVIRNGIDGVLVQNNGANWFNAIDGMVANADERVRMAYAARTKVQAEHSLKGSVEAWNLTLNSLRQASKSSSSLGFRFSYSWKCMQFSLQRLNRLRISRRRKKARGALVA